MPSFLLLLVLAGGQTLKGPIDVEYLYAHDADTVYVNVPAWPTFFGTRVGMRLKGYAAPEIRDPNEADRKLAVQGRDYVEQRIGTALLAGGKIQFRNVTKDKFHDRYDAEWILDGVDLGPELHRKGFVRPWNGRGIQPFKENDRDVR